jgi:4-diphosphocytidyl-2C-methyl-D-erythritol kinase
VLVVVPPFGVNTAKAYQELDAGRNENQWFRGSIVLEPDALGTWGGIGRLGGNDFESPVFGKEPGLKTLFEQLAETRPLMARMSGSGSALIAIYKSERDRDDAAETIGSLQATLIRTATKP